MAPPVEKKIMRSRGKIISRAQTGKNSKKSYNRKSLPCKARAERRTPHSDKKREIETVIMKESIVPT